MEIEKRDGKIIIQDVSFHSGIPLTFEVRSDSAEAFLLLRILEVLTEIKNNTRHPSCSDTGPQ